MYDLKHSKANSRIISSNIWLDDTFLFRRIMALEWEGPGIGGEGSPNKIQSLGVSRFCRKTLEKGREDSMETSRRDRDAYTFQATWMLPSLPQQLIRRWCSFWKMALWVAWEHRQFFELPWPLSCSFFCHGRRDRLWHWAYNRVIEVDCFWLLVGNAWRNARRSARRKMLE